MDVPARPAALPEWQECVGAFQVRCRRPEGREAPERSTTGLPTAWPHKPGDTLAQAVPGTRAPRVQACLTNMHWDEEDLNRPRVQRMVVEVTRGDGVLGCAETGFPQHGRDSVGGERQYAGTVGNVATARGWCPAAIPLPRPPGRWRSGCTCRRPGLMRPSGGRRRGCPQRSRGRPRRRSRWPCSIRRGRGGPASLRGGRCRRWGDPELPAGLGGAAIVLEPLAPRHASRSTGRGCPSAACHRTVSCRGDGPAGLGPGPGPSGAGVSSPRGDRHAGRQRSGLAGATAPAP